LIEGLKAGHVRALAKAISLAEDDPVAGERLAAQLGSPGSLAMVVGITGASGVGKSTLINALVECALKAPRRIGVLAIDPSSPLSGGALLGDRFRMAFPQADPRQLFIRSLASRGNDGGISRGVEAGIGFLRHAGYDVVLVETTGAGQCEFDVVRMVDLVCLLLAEGCGDELQVMKSGLMEIADVMVINKCGRPGTERLRRDLESHLADSCRFEQFGLLPPKVLLTDALSQDGVIDLWQHLEWLHRDTHHLQASGRRRQHLLRYSAMAGILSDLKGRLVTRMREHPQEWGASADAPAQTRRRLLEVCREELARMNHAQEY